MSALHSAASGPAFKSKQVYDLHNTLQVHVCVAILNNIHGMHAICRLQHAFRTPTNSLHKKQADFDIMLDT